MHAYVDDFRAASRGWWKGMRDPIHGFVAKRTSGGGGGGDDCAVVKAKEGLGQSGEMSPNQTQRVGEHILRC